MILLSVILFIIVALMALVVFVLLIPFYFEVNSIAETISFRIHHLASGSILLTDETVVLRLRITWWTKEYNLLNMKTRPTKITVKPSTKQKKKTTLPKHLARKVWAVIKSFQLKQCLVNIDTGDMPTNGLLFPLFYWMERWAAKPIAVNFNGDNIIILEIENTMGRMLWAYLRA